jgi:protein-L-isoaspartate(D-aspartate) O-methyltransferase
VLIAYPTLFTLVRGLEKNEWEKLVDTLTRESILHSPNVIKAMRAVPREKFLPENMLSYSAVDTPLPIGFGQTASAPHGLGSPPGLGETWFQS